MTAIQLSFPDLLIASCSLLIGTALSIMMALNICRSLFIAVVRMCAQLVFVGMLLRYAFALSSPYFTLLIAIAMLAAASYEVPARQAVSFKGWVRFGLGGAALTISTVFVVSLAMATALREAEWSDARHIIPILGIVLGTAMNCTSLALNSILTSVKREQRSIEARLALGADRYLAFRELRASAVRNGLIPVINQMAGAGIITLPGVMTGQVLAGMDPLEAAKYQILLMLLLAGAGLIGVIIASHLAVIALTDHRDRLRLDRLDTI